MIVTRKQLREAEHGLRQWHKLRFEAAVGVTICGLVVGQGERSPQPGAGAAICDACMGLMSATSSWS